MLFAALAVQILIAVGAPIALWVYLRRRYHVAVMLLVAGGVAFIGSQVVHIPMLIGLTQLFKVWDVIPRAWGPPFNAVVLGLAAGVCEEVARYVVYRWWQTEARDYTSGIALGAGHGGVESVLLVGVGASVIVLALVVQRVAPQLLASSPEAAAAVAKMAATPPYMALLGGVERLVAITIHLSASVLVLQCFLRKSLVWLFAAIAWHSTVDGVTVFVATRWGTVSAEGVAFAMALGAVAILLALRDRPAQEAAA